MLDDFRNAAEASFQEEEPAPQNAQPPRRRRNQPLFLGMTAPQRFVLSIAIFLTTLIVGALCLIITGKIFIP